MRGEMPKRVRVGVLFVSLLAFGLVSLSQSPPSAPLTYAIVNARIVMDSERVLKKGHIVIRDGLIEQVGTEVIIPADAEIIQGDGLVVYPGFIDAHATSGLQLPEWRPDQDTPPDTLSDAPSYMRLANRKGIRPELRAVEHLTLTDTVLVPYRQGGFTTALIAPSGGAINGTSVLVNLSGAPKRECVVKPVVAMHFAFQMPRTVRGYPTSLMGIFAHLRQTLLDAHYFRALQAAFENGSGKRPPADEALEALQPVLLGTMSVVFDADTEIEIRRALRFADEFGLRLIISGGREGWKVADELAKRKIPVLVSVAFGPEPRTTTGHHPAPSPPTNPYEPQAEEEPAAPERAEEETPDPVLQERRRQWEERLANAAKLHQAGVLIAFTTRGNRTLTEFWQNLRRAVKSGLPKEVALQALTINPAKIFGVERHMGTLEQGKVANLVVMTGDFMDEKARVRYLFIDGRKFEPERERIAPQPVTSPTERSTVSPPRLPVELPPEDDGCFDDGEQGGDL